jgi:hypothetical protein
VPVKVAVTSGKKDIGPLWPRVRLSDDRAATKAVREFFEALIKEDYAAAQGILDKTGLTLPDIDEEDRKDLSKLRDQVKFLRIVEIGKPVPHPETKDTEVPVKVELEMAGRNGVQHFSPFVRPVFGQPDRWEICGGI